MRNKDPEIIIKFGVEDDFQDAFLSFIEEVLTSDKDLNYKKGNEKEKLN